MRGCWPPRRSPASSRWWRGARRTIEAWEQPARPARADAIPVGARVFHQKFGYGTVTSAEDDRLDVAFDKAGRQARARPVRGEGVIRAAKPLAHDRPIRSSMPRRGAWMAGSCPAMTDTPGPVAGMARVLQRLSRPSPSMCRKQRSRPTKPRYPAPVPRSASSATHDRRLACGGRPAGRQRRCSELDGRPGVGRRGIRRVGADCDGRQTPAEGWLARTYASFPEQRIGRRFAVRGTHLQWTGRPRAGSR